VGLRIERLLVSIAAGEEYVDDAFGRALLRASRSIVRASLQLEELTECQAQAAEDTHLQQFAARSSEMGWIIAPGDGAIALRVIQHRCRSFAGLPASAWKPGVRNELLGPPKLGVFRSLGKAVRRPGGTDRRRKSAAALFPPSDSV